VAAERIVINTGPLIALGRAEALEPMKQLPIEFIAPGQVRAELEFGETSGHDPAALHSDAVRFVGLANPLSPLSEANLGSGEAAVIQLALDEAIPIVGIDERRGRRAATAVGLQVTGTLGVLGRLKTSGLIAAVRPLLDRLRGGRDWFSEELVEQFLKQLGE
jgi:predicted nucleic acid-binding protein